MQFRRLLSTLAAVLTLAAGAVQSPVSGAAPVGNIVTLGDSYTANPDQIRNSLRRVNIPAVQDFVGNYPHQSGCLQGPNNWPRKLGARVGAPVADWSCNAQSSRTVIQRLDRAIETGDLHAGTRAVVISVGINDYGLAGVQQGLQPWNPTMMTENYVANMRIAADKVRHVAPNAKLVLSGMIAISHPSAPHMFCPLNVVPNAPGGFPFPALAAAEAGTENNQRAAAQATGATFVDMRLPSGGHGTCAPDRERYVAGIIDTTTPNYNMNTHPSDLGSQFIADRLAPHV